MAARNSHGARGVGSERRDMATCTAIPEDRMEAFRFNPSNSMEDRLVGKHNDVLWVLLPREIMKDVRRVKATIVTIQHGTVLTWTRPTFYLFGVSLFESAQKTNAWGSVASSRIAFRSKCNDLDMCTTRVYSRETGATCPGTFLSVFDTRAVLLWQNSDLIANMSGIIGYSSGGEDTGVSGKIFA